jgi:hypothetical protein
VIALINLLLVEAFLVAAMQDYGWSRYGREVWAALLESYGLVGSFALAAWRWLQVRWGELAGL